MLTPSIARRALGSGSHLTRKAQPNPHETQCQYESASGDAVTVMVGDWSLIHPFSSPDEKAVGGFGNEAYLSGTSFDVRKGSRGIDITAFTRAGTFSGSAASKQNAADAAFQEKIAGWLLPRL